jgi:hypothetical protein
MTVNAPFFLPYLNTSCQTQCHPLLEWNLNTNSKMVSVPSRHESHHISSQRNSSLVRRFHFPGTVEPRRFHNIQDHVRGSCGKSSHAVLPARSHRIHASPPEVDLAMTEIQNEDKLICDRFSICNRYSYLVYYFLLISQSLRLVRVLSHSKYIPTHPFLAYYFLMTLLMTPLVNFPLTL